MSLLIFQLIVVLFAIATIFNILQMKQKGSLTPRASLFWVLFWFAVAGAVIRPDSIQMIARTFGIGRGSDFVLYISVITLFFLVFRLHIKIEKINRDVTKVVREKSLKKK